MGGEACARARGDMPRIIVGALQTAPNDPSPAPAVILSYTGEASARWAAKVLLYAQNGKRPFETGPAIYLGDTNIEVRLSDLATGARPHTFCEIAVKADRRHVTCALYVAGKVQEEAVKAFKQLLEMGRGYTFTVAWDERVLTDEIELVKYTIKEKGARG